VLVAAGATSGTFVATTSAVAATTSATITASYGGVNRTAALTVTPVPVVPPVSLSQDAGFPRTNAYGWTTGSKNFTFTTPGADRLVVVGISYTNYFWAATTSHTVSGGGLAWTKAREALTDSNSAFVSLWYAWVPAAGTYTATFNPVVSPQYDAFLTVHSFSGSSSAGIGATGGMSGNGSLPRVASIATTGEPSYLLAVGFHSNGTAPTVDASSTRTAVDVSSGMAFWTQRGTVAVAAGTYSIGLTAPVAPRSWAMAAVEIKAAASGPVPASLASAAVSPTTVVGGIGTGRD